MALTPDELQELQELEELEQLEALEARGMSAARPRPEGNAAMAGLEGFGQTATMGYLPQLQAGAETAGDKLAAFLGFGPAAVDEDLREQGFVLPEQSYVQKRDENIARHEQQTETNPYASLMGKGAGLVATSFLPGMAGAKLTQGVNLGRAGTAAAKVGHVLNGGKAGAGVTGAVAQGMRGGAIQGAAYNPGDKRGEVDPLQVTDRIENAGTGMAFAGPLSAGGHAIAKGAQIHKNVQRAKDPAKLHQWVRDEVDTALTALDDNYIGPRARQVEAAVQDKVGRVNPDILRGTNTRSGGKDVLADTLAKKRNATAQPTTQPMNFEERTLIQGAQEGLPLQQTSSAPLNLPSQSNQGAHLQARMGQVNTPFTKMTQGADEAVEGVAHTQPDLFGRVPQTTPQTGAQRTIGVESGSRASLNPSGGEDLAGLLNHTQDALPLQQTTRTPINSSQSVEASHVQMGMPLQTHSPAVGTQGPVDMKLSKILRLRKLMDRKANRGKSKPFDNTSVARGEQAEKASNILRKQIDEVAPETRVPLKEQEEAYLLRNVLKEKMASSPITTLKSKNPDIEALIKMIDDRGGSTLSSKSAEIQQALDLLLDYRKFYHPLQAPNELRKLGMRGAVSVANKLNSVPTTPGTPSLQAALEAFRVKGSRK